METFWIVISFVAIVLISLTLYNIVRQLEKLDEDEKRN